jgi:hypothetical protein
MTFKEIADLEMKVASNEANATSDYTLQVLSEYIERERQNIVAPFIYFYEDVIANSLSFDFSSVLGEKSYKNCSDDARACLEISPHFARLPKYAIDGWLQNALKFTDHLVLHYIQETLKVLPQKYGYTGIEKSRYIHLKEMQGELSQAGENLVRLYELRSKQFEHRTRIENNGKQTLLAPPRNPIRREVTKLFPSVLKIFLRVYQSAYPAASEV